MDLSMKKPDVEWYNALPKTGPIYDLINTATFGMSKRERLQAVIALGESDDPRAVRPLMELLRDGDPEIRIYATSALGTLKSGRAVHDLIGRLRDKSEQLATRQQAAAALAAIRSNTAIQGLKECIADENEDPTIRSYARDVLSGMRSW
jgi:HEAT repeat protein